MTASEEVAVIIPTLATAERAPYLLRAIESVTTQAGVRGVPLVVANGPGADPGLLAGLAQRLDVILHRQAPASLPAAIQTGRRLVTTRCFGGLDDDDLLLPGALAERLMRLDAGDRPDAVVSNGILRDRAGDRIAIADVERVRRDPLRALLECNWMLPGGALFRTESITPDVLSAMPKHLESTFLGLVLASRFRIAFLADPTVVHHTDLPFSIDRSPECRIGRPGALRSLLSLPLPNDVRQTLRERIGATCHEVSEYHWREGRWLAAWRWHLRSLAAPRGLRYVGYTRHLLLAPARASNRAVNEVR